MIKRVVCVAVVLAALGAGSARAELVPFTLEDGVESNFGYSLIHLPFNSRGNGRPVYWLDGTFLLDLADDGFTVVDVQWNLREFTRFGDDVASLPVVGTATLDPSQPSVFSLDNRQGRPDGELHLRFDIQDVGPGEATFRFLPRRYGRLPNAFDGQTLYLWGATSEIEGFDDWPGGVSALGMDLKGVAVPDPATAIVLVVGGLVGGLLRRR